MCSTPKEQDMTQDDALVDEKHVIVEISELGEVADGGLLDCGVCFNQKSTKEVHRLTCCGNTLCHLCYDRWHIEEQRPECAFCRSTVTLANAVDLESNQDTAQSERAARRLLKIDTCRLVCVCVFWLIAILVVLVEARSHEK